MQIRREQLGSLRVFGESAVLITAKKCQTLDEYRKKTLRGATSYKQTITILEYDNTFS